MLEITELVWYVFGFWAFVFSRRFRAAVVETWRTSGFWGRVNLILEAVSATLIGVVLPLSLLACLPVRRPAPDPLASGPHCFEQTYRTPPSLGHPSATTVDTILLDTVPGFRWKEDGRPRWRKGYRTPIAAYRA